jgi:SulP family sulfate permease
LVGFGLGALLFLHRLAQAVSVEAEQDLPDKLPGADRTPYDPALATNRDVAVYRISGAFFFGAAASVAAALDRIGQHPKVHVIDFSAVPVIDSTAVATIDGFIRKTERNGARVIISGAAPSVERALGMHGVHPPRVEFRPSVPEALRAIAAAPGRSSS